MYALRMSDVNKEATYFTIRSVLEIVVCYLFIILRWALSYLLLECFYLLMADSDNVISFVYKTSETCS